MVEDCFHGNAHAVFRHSEHEPVSIAITKGVTNEIIVTRLSDAIGPSEIYTSADVITCVAKVSHIALKL